MAQRPLINPKKALTIKKTSPKREAGAAPAKKRAIDASGSGKRPMRSAKNGESLPSKGILRCTGCGAVFYDKHWHSPALVREELQGASMLDALCEACHAGIRYSGTSTAGFAGEVVLEGVAPQHKAEIIGTVRNIAKRASLRDPLARILRLDDRGGKIVAYTEENQLAVAIGKELHASRKGGSLTITWSDDDKPVRVHWKAKAL